MLVLFMDNSDGNPTFACADADYIDYDMDDGTIYFWCGSICWVCECSLIIAEQLIRSGFTLGRFDLSSYNFKAIED